MRLRRYVLPPFAELLDDLDVRAEAGYQPCHQSYRQEVADNMAKALNRFTKEDPTFNTYVDPESNQTIIQEWETAPRGLCRAHAPRVQGRCGHRPTRVAYREAISQRADFNYTHKKQDRWSANMHAWPVYSADRGKRGGEGVRVRRHDQGGVIPTEYVPSCDKGFSTAIKKGTQLGFPVVGVRAVINDGAFHPVDSSDQAFQTAALGAFREAYERAKPVILEPVMKVVVEGPTEFQGNIFGSINQRRGIIISSTEDGAMCSVEAEVPLSEMFGYSTVLRSLTQGKAEFTMELAKYSRVPQSVGEALKTAYIEKKKKEQK
jgi:elongation factor G